MIKIPVVIGPIYYPRPEGVTELAIDLVFSAQPTGKIVCDVTVSISCYDIMTKSQKPFTSAANSSIAIERLYA